MHTKSLGNSSGFLRAADRGRQDDGECEGY